MARVSATLSLVVAAIVLGSARALDNGVARTPPSEFLLVVVFLKLGFTARLTVAGHAGWCLKWAGCSGNAMPATLTVIPSPIAVSGEPMRTLLRYIRSVWSDARFFDPRSENLFMRMADLLVSEGYKDAGYEFVNIDVSVYCRRRKSA